MWTSLLVNTPPMDATWERRLFSDIHAERRKKGRSMQFLLVVSSFCAGMVTGGALQVVI